MLYYIYLRLFNNVSFLRVFKYITVRSMIAFFLSFFIVIFAGKPFINYLKKKKIGDDIRKEGPKTHYNKQGTPTMGGLLILFSIILTVLITGNWTNQYTSLLFISTLFLGGLGFYDDFKKFTVNKKGLAGKKKILAQVILSIIVWFFIKNLNLGEISFSIVNPFFKNSYIYIGSFLMLLFIIFIIVGSSNAVNITDGLDGLVIVPVMIVSLTLAIVAYFTGNTIWSKYLNLYYIEGTGEIVVFLASIIGSGLGFLWYNFYPAQIFMGDTGSLALGGLLGIISILLKQEILLGIIGIIFVIEALSVIIQVWSFKRRGKRVFKMAPIHHHFEILGVPETKVTARFWIISIMFSILGLLILKLR